MPIIERYPYKTIKKVMKDSLLEYLDTLNANRDILSDLTGSVYRNTVLTNMKEKDEHIKELFDTPWADNIKDPIMGTEITMIISSYLEDMLKDLMDDINENHAEFMDVFNDWEKRREGFNMALVYAEELITEDEYENAMAEYKALLKKMADKEGLTLFQMKRKMPPFDNPFDAITWLEHKMDVETIDDFIENPEEDESTVSDDPGESCGLDIKIDKDNCGCG
jgi:hypothetical protein